MNLFVKGALAPVFLLGLSAASWAGPVGPEFQVNSETSGLQGAPDVAGLGNGGFVVAFGSYSPASNFDIYGQRFRAAGGTAGGQFRINKHTPGQQYYPSAAGLTDGGFVVIWASRFQDGDSDGVYGQRYDAAGKRVGKREFRVNRTTANAQSYPSVASLEDGGFVVAWQSNIQDGQVNGVYGQRYDAAGNRVGKREFRVNKYTVGQQNLPAVAGVGGGGFVVTWQSDIQDGSGFGVYGQRYDAAGSRVGKREFRVNRQTIGAQGNPSVAGLADGSFAVTWASFGQDGDVDGVYAQRYDAAGGRVGKREFRVNRTTEGQQSVPDIAGLGDGGVVISWDSETQDGSGYGVYGQRYDASGSRVGQREFQANTYTSGNQEEPSVAGLGGGGFVVTWQSNFQDGDSYGVYGQRYAP